MLNGELQQLVEGQCRRGFSCRGGSVMLKPTLVLVPAQQPLFLSYARYTNPGAKSS